MPPLHPEISEQLRAPSGTAQVEIAVVVDPTVSLCLQQNSVPLVKRILLKNVGATALTELSVRVRAEPVFALPLSLGVAALGPGEQRTLDSVDLLLTPEYLVALTETGRGLLHVEVDCAGRTVGSHAQTVEVLAYDQWSGSRSLVELLAAFVMPNHPVVEHLLGESATLLRASSLSDAFDGYQRESRNAVQHMVGAIYEAVRREGLGYIMPPASFEESGQKIRTPERVLQNRMGTCLDLTLLLAACFEQAGLHPLVVLLKGHAFVGVWLEERTLSTASDDDPIELRKRIDAGEMLAIESTLLTGAQSQPFDKAVKQGRQHLDDVTKFHFAVDVTRARKAMIRPMHGRVADNGVFQPMARLVERPLNNGPLPAMQVLREAIVLPQAADDVGETRLDRWRRKLLDLTLNNRLLNFRHGAKTLPVLCPDLGRFEDLLADGAQFQLRARPEEFSTKDTRDGASYKRSTGDDAVSAVLREALSGKRLHIDLDQAVLDRRVLEIYREARLAHEESGTSALYCALGFLNWYQSDDSDRPRSAPLLLLPVNLVRASVDQGFKLEVGDDEPRVNVSLLELLQQDFEMAVRGLDPLPTDEHGIDVRRVFDLFRSAVAGMKRWEVIEDVQVGFFSFSKFLMWRDLQEHAADLLQNSVVNHLVHHRTENFDPGGPIPKAEALDRERPPAMMFCPMSADSSQLAAVFAAADGRSFVLEGPPGTGKSQTITNIIAQCLALGKSVLFVAEKNVALNVVHERLEASGLGEYCLELHSNKAKKTDVMRQLERAMARAPSGEPPEWARTSQRVEHLRRNLNEYVSALHRPRVSGESVYQGLAHLIGHSAVPLVRLDFGALGRVDQGQLATLRELAQRIQTVGGSLGPVGSHPWRFVTRGGWDPLWQRKVEQHLAALLHAIDDVTARLEEAVRILGLAGGSRTVAQLSLLAEASGVLIGPPYVPAAMVVESDWAQLQRRISAVLEVGRRRDAVRERVRRTFSDAVIQADLSPVLATLKAAAAAWAPLRWLRRVLVRRGLRPLFLPGRDLPLDALQGDVEHALALKQEETSLATLGAPVAAALGALYDGGEGRWDDIQRAMTWTGSARSAAMAIAADNPSEAAAVRRRWAELAAEAPEALAQSAPKGQALGMFVRAVRALEAHAAVFEAETGKAPGSLLNSGPSADLAGVTASLRELAKLTSRLRGWCQWKEVRDAAVGARLAPIVEALEGGQVAAGDVSAVLDKAYYQWFTEHTLNEDAVLRAFHSSEHGRLIAEFGLADTAHQALSGDAIRARLSTRVPASDAAAGKGSALGILRKETHNHVACFAIWRCGPCLAKQATWLCVSPPVS